MLKDDFLDQLTKVVEDEYTEVLVYFVLKSSDEIKKADFRKDVLNAVKKGLIESLNVERSLFDKDPNCDVVPLSQSDDRKNVVYQYDLDDKPPFLKTIETVATPQRADIEVFRFESDKLSDIEYFVFEMGTADNKIVLCRKNFPFNLMHQSNGRFFFTKSDSQFELISDDILRMDSAIDGILIDGMFYVLNMAYLDNNQDFVSIISKKATEVIGNLKKLDIADMDCMKERLSDISFSRRLIKISSNSPVLKLSAQSILDFVSKDASLSRVLRIKEGKIDLSSKKAQNSFIKLLNDDYLYSRLTKNKYETLAKNKL